jgi:hypothetical protein
MGQKVKIITSNGLKPSQIDCSGHCYQLGGRPIQANFGLTNGNGLSDNNFRISHQKPDVDLSNQGLIELNGFTNGNGLTDGNGLTNGNGLTLTKLQSPRSNHKASKIKMLHHQAIKSRILSCLLAIILIILPIIIYSIDLTSPIKSDDVFIDNEFNDWDTNSLIDDEYLDQPNNPNIDIKRYQVDKSDSFLSFFIEVDGNIFHGISKDSNHYPDGISILIDSDSNVDTGYLSNDLGADYLIDLRGYNSKITHNGLYKFDWESVNDQNNWNGFEYISNVNVGTDSCRLEGEVLISGLEDNSEFQTLIVTQDHTGNSDESDNILSPGKELLSATMTIQPPDFIHPGEKNVEFLSIELKGSTHNNEPVLVEEFSFTCLGNSPINAIEDLRLTISEDPKNLDLNINIESTHDGDTKIKTIGALGNENGIGKERTTEQPSGGSYVDSDSTGLGSTYDSPSQIFDYAEDKNTIRVPLSKPIEILGDSSVLIKAHVDISPTIQTGTSLGLELIDIETNNAAVTIIRRENKLAYVGPAPTGIEIDGSFVDWSKVEKIPDLDDSTVPNRGIDCSEYAISAEDDELNFYFKVTGELLATSGTPIQLNPINNEMKVSSKDNKGLKEDELEPLIPDKLIIKDTLRIFLDTDQNILTGFNPSWMPVGAEYMLEITGRNGEIVDRTLFQYYEQDSIDNIWSWEFISNIEAAKDHSRIETALNLDLLNLDFESTLGCNIFYILSNWDNSVVDSSNIIDSKLNLQNSLYKEVIIQPQHQTRANNPYSLNNQHPTNSSSDNTAQPIVTNLDESAPGDGVYEISGKDSTYSWIECGYEPLDIPYGSIINNMTLYLGYRCDVNWNLSTGHKGIIWRNVGNGSEHNISDYTLSQADRDDIIATTTDLPTSEQLNNGIYLRINGKDEDGGSPDYFELDYLYFTLNYSVPNIVINEIMFDPTGNDNSSEWVELYNAGETAVDLTGWNITDSEGNKFILTSAGTLQPGDYLVCHIAQSGVNSSTDVYSNILFQDVIQPNATDGKDNYLDEASLNGNYGSATNLDVVNDPKYQRPLIQFNLSGIPQNGIINSKVWLYRYAGNSVIDAEITVHRITSNWTEIGSCWNTYDGSNDWPVNNNGGDWNETIEDSTTIVAERYHWYSWDITNLTKNWKNGTFQNYGMIFLNTDGDPSESFYSSDYSVNTSLRPKLIVDYWCSSQTMLDDIDSLSLIDQYGNIVDYVAWGADPGLNDDAAVSINQWTDGTSINTSNLAENETLARDKYSTDTDTTTDWENSTTTKADPYGINATASTPGEQNIDTVIPEFGVLAIPIIIITFIYFCMSRSQKPITYQDPKKDIKNNKKRKKFKNKGNNNAK